jgi:DNA-binding transcriptional ArsR family regulator
VPDMWYVRLAEIHADGCAYRVALYLLREARWSQFVTLSTSALRKLGVSRNGKRSALRQLREAGLIAVEERSRKNPVVKVRWLD